MVTPDSAIAGLTPNSAIIGAIIGARNLLFIANLQWSTKRRPVWRDQDFILRSGATRRRRWVVEAQEAL
jgi:hypothetical protein